MAKKDNAEMPEMEFRCPRIYFHRIKKLAEVDGMDMENYPEWKIIRDYVPELREEWKEVAADVFMEVSEVTGLPWREDKIVCYVTGPGRSASHPLTVCCDGSDTARAIDELVHELLHILQTRNRNRWLPWLGYVKEEWPGEESSCKSHILIHAVHKHLYRELFDDWEERLALNIERDERREGYRRSWEIVQKEGHDEIIKTFRELTNNS